MVDNPKLGEILVRHGMLTEQALAKALENQVVYGGRLGTNLVELDLARIDDVARCLVVQQGYPQATAEMLSNIDEQVVALIPAEICTKYELLPLGRGEEGVHVAMTEPGAELLSRLQAFFNGPVKPFIIPELRLHFCLERNYGLPRPKRFLRLPDGSERKQQVNQRQYLAPTIDVPSGSFDMPAEPSDDSAQMVFEPIRGTGTHPSIPAVTQAPEPEEEDDGLLYLDELDRSEEPSPAQAETRAIATVLEVLDQASTGSEIAQMLVAPLCPETGSTVLFWVRGELAVGCCASGAGVDHSRVSDLVMPLDRPSVFKWSIEMEGVVRAAAGDDPAQASIAEFLGTEIPSDVCIAPVWLAGKVVNLVCIHSRPNERLPDTIVADLRVLAERAQIAYQRLMAQAKG